MTFDRILMLCTIGVLLVIVLFQRGCISHGSNVVIPKPADTMVHVKYIDSSHTKTVKVYLPTYIHGQNTMVTIHDTTYIPSKPLTNLDTMEAIKNYFATTVHFDSLFGADIKGWVKDSIGKNKLLGLTYGLKNNRKTFENVTNPAKFKFFIGGNIGLSTDLRQFEAGPQLSFITKSDQLYQASFSLPEKIVSFGMGWKIHLGK